jgi:hypothetical protein
VWIYDFVEDRTARGGKLKLLCVVDEYTRQCHAIRVEKRMGSHQVIETLHWLFEVTAGPSICFRTTVPTSLHTPCSTGWPRNPPRQSRENACTESFNDKLRSECLNHEVFANGHEAREVIQAWRCEYNERRPHSSVGYLRIHSPPRLGGTEGGIEGKPQACPASGAPAARRCPNS